MRTFKRPMFRKGGTTGGGIMDNVVERGQYEKGTDISLKDKIDAVMAAGGQSGLDDPLTQFLLQVGPNIATQTGGGGIIPNVLGAAKGPVANLLKDRASQKKTRQAIALDLFKDVDKDKATQFIRKAKQIAEDTGREYEDVLNELYQTEIRRKPKSAEDIERDEQSLKIQDIIDVTSTRSGPTLTTNQANLIYNDEIQLSKANPEAYNSFLRTSSKDKYVYKNDEYEGDINSEAGATLKDNSILGSLPENTYVYDITTGNFIYRQGKRVLKLDLDIQEG
jgi:hypothetical protein